MIVPKTDGKTALAIYLVLAAAVLFFVWSTEALDPPAPGERLSTQPQQTVSNEQQQQSQSERGTSTNPVVVRVLPAPPTKEEAARDQQQATYNRRTLYLTLAIAVFTGGLWIVGFLQWQTYEGQRRLMAMQHQQWLDVSEFFCAYSPLFRTIADALSKTPPPNQWHIIFKISNNTGARFDLVKFELGVNGLCATEVWDRRTIGPDSHWIETASIEDVEETAPVDYGEIWERLYGNKGVVLVGRVHYINALGEPSIREFVKGGTRPDAKFIQLGEFSGDASKQLALMDKILAEGQHSQQERQPQ